MKSISRHRVRMIGVTITLTLTGVTAGTWDVRLGDEDEDECSVKNQKISASEKFSIDDDDLLGCQAATEE